MTIPHAATRTSPTAEPDVVEILRSATVFAGLPDDAFARLAARCVRRTYRRNQYLWYQGDEGARLVIVASGLVKVVLSSPQGGEVVLTTLGPGAIIGELAVLDGSPRSASVVAAEPTTVVMLSRATVLELLNRYPSVLDAVLRANGIGFNVGGPKVVFVYSDTPANRQKHEWSVRAFQIVNADPAALTSLLYRQTTSAPGIRPIIVVAASPARTINVRATGEKMAVIAKLIADNDKR